MLMQTFDMRVHFGFARSPHVEGREDIYEKTVTLMKEFLQLARRYNQDTYGFSGKPIRCELYSSDILCSGEFPEIAKAVGGSTNMIVSSYQKDIEGIQADTVLGLDIKKNSLSYPSTVAEYVVNKSDVFFLVWDGNQDFQDGILWSVIQFCKQKHIPYYLINMEKLDDVSFSSDSYYVPYRRDRVAEYVRELYDHKEEEKRNDPIPLMGLWGKLHDRFIRKYDLKAKAATCTEDKLLSEACFTEENPCFSNHTMLTENFSYYDAKAVAASALYRASIYFRSILPMITTIFIAIGFYAETVLTFFFGSPSLLGMNIWVILAGLGFLIHALLNRYASRVARNPQVKRLRKDFLEARFIAEHLRVAIHCEPYGIPSGNAWRANSLVDRNVLAKLHHIIRQQEPVSLTQTAHSTEEAIAAFEMLIANQKAYHNHCIDRYTLITERLNRVATTMYTAGFVIVVARGFLQFLIPFLSAPMNLSAMIHQVKIESFIKSFANMLALVMPAWASYFSTKLNMNGYEWLLNNSRRMIAGYEAVEKKLADVKQHRNSYQVIEDVANDIMNLTQGDYTGWYQRMESQKFTRL